MEPTLVPIRQEAVGLQGFIGAWICGRDPNIIMDVGPASSIGYLGEELLKLGLERVDFVLLSHIHMDHAGGLADFLDRFPMARIVCHARGVQHLVDPGRLWEASLKTLGELARSYGRIRPVDEARFIPHTRARLPGLQVIETPGHAVHHLSFVYQGNLFVGEAAGVYYRMGDQEYLRAATPPPFFMESAMDSIGRLQALEDQPICFAHFGRNPSSRAMLQRAKAQLMRWRSVFEEEIPKGGADLTLRCTREILDRDPELKAFHSMGHEEQERELFFVTNSVKGFVEYLQKSQL